MALPPLADLPSFPPGEPSPSHVRREAARSDRALRARRVKELREGILKWEREADRAFPSQVILIRVTVGRNGVGAVVDFRDHRVGMAGVRHRVGGALALEPGDVLGHGERVGLRVALQALLEAVTD
jgi:hypothetical protein